MQRMKLKESEEKVESLQSDLSTKDSELKGLLKSVEAVCNKVHRFEAGYSHNHIYSYSIAKMKDEIY